MTIKIGINGFRPYRTHGCCALRCSKTSQDIEIVGINDLLEPADYLAYMLKYDSVHGRFDGDVSEHTEGNVDRQWQKNSPHPRA